MTKLDEGIIDLITSDKLNYFGYFYSYIDRQSSEDVDKIKLTINYKNNQKECIVLYNEEYIKTLSIEEIKYLLIHIVLHIYFNHKERDFVNESLCHLAQDIILYYYMKPLLTESYNEIKEINNENIINLINLVNEKYDGDYIFENIFFWLIDNGDINSDYLELFDNNYEIDKEDDLFLDSLKNKIEESYKTSKNIGNLPLDIKKLLDKINTPNIDYLQNLLNDNIEKVIGNLITKKTFKKLHKYQIKGLKGLEYLTQKINIILDTSASMNDIFKKLLKWVNVNGYIFNIIQIDVEINNILIDCDSDIFENKFEVSGGGGTKLNPAIKYISDENNELYEYPTVIITDGFTDILDVHLLKNDTLIITKDKIPQTNGNNFILLKIPD